MSEVILNTDDRAAKFVENISGWVSRDGWFFGGNEEAARYRGCTHVACGDCGEPVEKSRNYCDACAEKRADARYEKLERAEWDEKGMLYSEVADKFFSSWDEVADYLEEYNEQTVAPLSLRLVICEPEYMQSVDTDYWSHNMPDDWDGDLPGEVMAALDALNDALRAAGPVSWRPGKKAVAL
jgi:hypothetical protein